MRNSRKPSPARSQGVISTPQKQLRRTRSVGSPSRTNVRLSSIIEAYKVSPLPCRQSILNDDTDIDMPRRRSWWKKIEDNSRDVLELLERKELVEGNNIAEEFDVEVLSQENKNYAFDLPESSDGESIKSIVIPQRKLFTQKDNQPQIKFREIKNNRETLQTLNKSYVDQDKELNIGRKTLFNQPSKPRTKPVFPVALLNISANKTVNKSKELPTAEVNNQVRSLFGSRPDRKRKNMFADFIVSESEDEISEIQPKVFGFQKRNESKRRASSMSRHSPTSSIDLEMDDWRHLPSSTMVENQIAEATSPVKRIKLSNLLETKESEISTNTNNILNKTKQTNKSVSSKNKSKNLSNICHEDDKSNEKHNTPRNATTNNRRVTRSMDRSLKENSVTASNVSKNLNKTKNQTPSKGQDKSNKLKSNTSIKNVSQGHSHKVQEKQNMLIDHPDPDEDFTLEYDNDDNEVVPQIETSLKNYNKITKDKTDSNKVSNYSKIQNNSQEIRNVVGLNKDSTMVQNLNRSFDKEKNKNKSIRNSVENDNNMQKEQSVNKNLEKKMELSKTSQNLKEDNFEDQVMESENEQNKSDNHYEQHSDIEEEVNESTQEEETNEGEHQENESETENVSEEEAENEEQAVIHENNSETENVSEDEADNEEQAVIHENNQENESETENVSEEEADNEEQAVIHENNTIEADQEIILDDRRNNIEDKNQVTLPNVSHNTTGRHRSHIKSPEVILHGETKQIDSFTIQTRNKSVRKTKSITFHNKLETVKSTGFSDATGNSSAEGSGWDSHRTTRKTLRQTFGRDFTPRKSLRALVMEKTAKLQANYTEVVNNVKIPLANSTAYDQVQDESDSYPETELLQVEQNIETVQADDRSKTIQIEKDQQVDVRNVTERLEERDETGKFEKKYKTELLKERNEVDKFKSQDRHEIGLFEERDETEQSEKRDETKLSEKRNDIDQSKNEDKDETEHFEKTEELEESEEREELEQSEEREEMEQSEEREEMEQSEEREEMEQSEEEEEMEQLQDREEIEQSEDREEMEQSKEREEIEQSEEREEIEQSEEEEEMEQLQDREEMEQSEDREEMEQSKEREEIEQSEEREEIEQSEEEEEMEQLQDREEMEQSEDREEMEQSEEREEIEQSEDDESNEAEQFEEGYEREQSENDDSDGTDQFEERNEMEQSEGEVAQFEERDETVPNNEIIAEVSKGTTQTSLETYLQKFKQDNDEKRRQRQEELRNSLKNSKRDAFSLFKVPQRPVRRTIKIQKPKAKQIKSTIPLEMLPAQLIQDMKYKPPKRFRPNNAAWITKRLYKFLENKLESKYDYRARVRAEKLVECMYQFSKEARRQALAPALAVEELKQEMARLDVVKTHFDFYEFCREFFPREIRIKVIPDIVNGLPLPRHGVFSDILR